MVYIQKKRQKMYSRDFFEFKFERYTFQHLYKRYKGNIPAIIAALYRDRYKKETRIHRWLLNFYIPAVINDKGRYFKKFTYRDFDVPLKSILDDYFCVDIELLYDEVQKNTVNYQIHTIDDLEAIPHTIRDFINSIGCFNHLKKDNTLFSDFSRQLRAPFTSENKRAILQSVMLMEYSQMVDIIETLDNSSRATLFGILGEYFHREDSEIQLSLVDARKIVWAYDIPVEWPVKLLLINKDFLAKRYMYTDIFPYHGVMLEYWIQQHPEHMPMFTSILDGVKARPSEIVHFFKTGEMPPSFTSYDGDEVALM